MCLMRAAAVDSLAGAGDPRQPSSLLAEGRAALAEPLEETATRPPTEEGRRQLKDMSYAELEDFVVRELGDERRRAKVLWWWLYRAKYWASHPSQMEGVGMAFRAKLAERAAFDSLQLDGVRVAKDGTRKVTFRLPGGRGGGIVESVLIPHVGDHRNTVCVSSQLGCAMGCRFCFTARMGLHQSLTAGEIVDQVVQVRRLFARDVGPITNVVFMGMGEPLHNLPSVTKALRTLTDRGGLACSPLKVTVSTSGLVPEIREFCRPERLPAALAVSLNATTDEVRDYIMPINRRYNLSALMGCLHELFPQSRRAERSVLLEYIMLDGVNDTDEDAARLLHLTKGLACKVNLIAFNPHDGTEFRPSPAARVLAFRDVLLQGGRMTFIRRSRGDDEMAACGQLGKPGGTAGRPVGGRAETETAAVPAMSTF